MNIKLQGHAGIRPNNIYCIGRNYADHAKELNNPVPAEPVIFLKTNASLRGLNEQAPLAYADESFHHEAEIVLLINKPIPLGSKVDYAAVAGLGLGLDLTRRNKQNELKKAGLPWTLAKSFDGAALVSEFLPLAKFQDPKHLEFTLTINGERRQTGDSRAMIFSIPVILNFVLSFHSLQPGDLIYTGTPAGVAEFKAGDKFVLEWTKEKLPFAGKL